MEKYVHTNRYGDEIVFEDKGHGLIFMSGYNPDHIRCGGKPFQETLNTNDLGMVDPSGGPYIELGQKILGKTIKNISLENDIVVLRY